MKDHLIAEVVQTGQLIVGGAVISVAFLAGLALAIVVVFALALIRAAAYYRRVDQDDVGPDALQLLEDLDAHLNQHADHDPDLTAGFVQLRGAIRDEQQKEAGDV